MEPIWTSYGHNMDTIWTQSANNPQTIWTQYAIVCAVAWHPRWPGMKWNTNLPRSQSVPGTLGKRLNVQNVSVESPHIPNFQMKFLCQAVDECWCEKFKSGKPTEQQEIGSFGLSLFICMDAIPWKARRPRNCERGEGETPISNYVSPWCLRCLCMITPNCKKPNDIYIYLSLSHP